MAVMVLARVRSDALPETLVYTDDGCEVSPTCLDCPLPVCRYDVVGGLRAIRNSVRDRKIAELHVSGVHPRRIAAMFGVSKRTVFRVLSPAYQPSHRLQWPGWEAMMAERAQVAR